MNKIGLNLFGILALSGSAFGHGVQVQISYDPAEGRIATREIVETDSRPTALSELKRVYVMPLMSQTGGAGDGWYTRPDDTRNGFGVPVHPTGPGLTFQYDTQLPGSGWSFSGSSTLPNLQGSNFTYEFVDGLKQWDGSAFVDAGVEQLQHFRGDGTTVPTVLANTSDAGPFAQLPLGAINTQSSNPHSSTGMRILGDGTAFGLTGPAAGDDGVYLVSMRLLSSALGVSPSETFHYVMFKNATPDEAMAAAASLGFEAGLIQLVPEPTTLTTCILGVALLARRRPN